MDCIILHLADKWSLYSQIYGGTRHDININWFADEKDKLFLERSETEISIYKVKNTYFSYSITSNFHICLR